MNAKTTERPQTAEAPRESVSQGEVAIFAPPRLAWHPAIEDRFKVDKATWFALIDAVWPNAKTTDAICLALSYCQHRNLDPMKKPCHIVPMWSNTLKRMVETVWPSIGELRTTAFRTGEYAGHDPVEYGPDKVEVIGNAEVRYPEWCRMTVHRLVKGKARPFPGARVYWRESYATAGRDDPTPNAMWLRRPHGQLEKCAEAAALRGAFPEEIGNEYVVEEMEGRTIDGTVASAVEPGPRPSRAQFETAQPEESAETYPLADEVGETQSKATSPNQWGTDLYAMTGPTIDGRFTDKALAILANNRESFDLLGPQMSDTIFGKLQARYLTADELDKKIERAAGRVGQLEGDLREARKNLDALYILRAERDFGIKAGMRVRDRKGEAVVSAVDPRSSAGRKPWLYVNRLKKHGSPSEREVCMYSDWEICGP